MLERSKGRGQINLDHLSWRLRGWDGSNGKKTKPVTEKWTTKPREPDLAVEALSSRGSMTHCSESLMEAVRPNTILTSKTTTKIAAWNIHTMYEAAKAAHVAAEMNNYMSLLGLSETRWTQSGQVRLSTGETVLYSGHEEEDGTHTEGVALMLRALISREAIRSRIITVKIRTKVKNINM